MRSDDAPNKSTPHVLFAVWSRKLLKQGSEKRGISPTVSSRSHVLSKDMRGLLHRGQTRAMMEVHHFVPDVFLNLEA